MLTFTRIDDGFAHEVSGIELWRPLAEDDVQSIAEHLRVHGVLVFRRQSLSEQELVDFSARFGELDRIVREDWAANHPAVIRISNLRNGAGEPIGGLDANELDWHTDQSYMREPATGAVLQMVEMPNSPVDTHWANLKLAYNALKPAQKETIDGLRGIYQYAKRQASYGEGKLKSQIQKKTPDVMHPFVTRDPVSGEKSLYLDPSTMTGIVDRDPSSADQLLRELREHATRPAFCYRHRWRVGDVVMWDNGFLLHRRGSFDTKDARLLKRTTIRLPKTRHIVPS